MEDHKSRRVACMAMMCAMMQGSAGMMGDNEILLLIFQLHKKSESYTRLAHTMSNPTACELIDSPQDKRFAGSK
jgi:hypothetical protein